MHNLPGPEWDTWNRQMRRTLIETQAKEGCAAGSWDPEKPARDHWGEQEGRLMVTSMGALTLEVYYRYLPLYQLDKTEEAGQMAKAPRSSDCCQTVEQPPATFENRLAGSFRATIFIFGH